MLEEQVFSSDLMIEWSIKMKKLIICVAALLLAMAIGCGANKDKETASAEETAVTKPEAVEEEEPEKPDYYVFDGTYDDEYSQRAMMEATAEEDHLHIVVSWSESAFAYYRWELNAKMEENRLVYSDCINEYFAADDSPEGPEHKTLYTGGTGYFEVENGKLKWTGAEDPDCRECVFSK